MGIFIGHCLIPLDPCLKPTSNVGSKINLKETLCTSSTFTPLNFILQKYIIVFYLDCSRFVSGATGSIGQLLYNCQRTKDSLLFNESHQHGVAKAFHQVAECPASNAKQVKFFLNSETTL